MFKVLDEVCTPTKGSKYSACIDLYAREDVTIGAGETAKIPLGVCIDLDFNALVREYNNMPSDVKAIAREEFIQSHYLELHPRSSLRAKGLISNTGIIDLDFTQELQIIIHNPYTRFSTFNNTGRGALDCTFYNINKGEKIAQIMLMEHQSFLFGIETDDERTGGFGSTGE